MSVRERRLGTNSISLGLALIGILAGCVSKPKAPPTDPNTTVSVLSLNVENLFDLDDDEGKNDEAFLPLEKKRNDVIRNRCFVQADNDYRQQECLHKDWSAKILRRKMERLTHLLEQINNGRGPDIIILSEVENLNVLKMWRDQYLQKMDYQTAVLVEGPDERGIDNAVLSRLPLIGEPKNHLMDYSKAPDLKPGDIRPTRGILEAHLRLPNGDKLAVFGVHFPSQGAETIHRKVAVETLMDVTAKVEPGTAVIVGGDFNITAKEEHKQKYYRDIVAPKFSVSHMVGCQDCVGTTYWHQDRTWSFFDVLLFSKELTEKQYSWRLDPSTIHLPTKSKYQINRYGSPAKFQNGKGSVGVTDHFPVYAEIKLVPLKTVGAAQ